MLNVSDYYKSLVDSDDLLVFYKIRHIIQE